MHRYFPFRQARRRGGVLVTGLFAAIATLGIVALTVDGGTLMEQRVRVRAAADAAALAAEDQLFRRYLFDQGLDPAGAAAAAARANAAANGYANDGTDSIVTVNLAPANFQGGRRVGEPIPPGTVEVIIRWNQPRLFSVIWGGGRYPVVGRAVASGGWSSGASGMVVLNPTASGSLTTTSSGNSNIQGAIVVDSNSPTAVKFTSTGNITAGEHNYTGNYSVTNAGHPVGTINLGTPPIPDPLAFLPVPSVPTTDWGKVNLSGSGSTTLQPGHYTQIQVSGSQNVTLMPGLYYIDNGFSWNSSGTLTGSGVMFYNVANTFGLTQGTWTLSGPTSGVYQGVAIWQARDNTSNVTLTGSGAINLTGTVYCKASLLTLTGPSGVNGIYGSQTISDRLSMTGSSAISLQPSSGRVPAFRRCQIEE